jgi:AraC-like DNA-binding protein
MVQDFSMTSNTLTREAAIEKCKELAGLVARQTDCQGDGVHATAIEQLAFMRQSASSTSLRGVTEPMLAIVVQGEKEALLHQETHRYRVAQYLVVSVDLPLHGCAIATTPDRPYLGLKLTLDPVQLCDIIAQTHPAIDQKENSMRGWFISDAEPSLIDCAIRLTKLLDTPQDIPFLAPLIVREIYYRLLVGEQGELVRQIATFGSTMQRIAEAIKQIKADFTKPLRVEDLALTVNMSPSSFHRHFKEVTSISPLQYQKQLRLIEARHLMLAKNSDASHAAYQVGYESTSQFSREYARMFGAPPIKDIERLRAA